MYISETNKIDKKRETNKVKLCNNKLFFHSMSMPFVTSSCLIFSEPFSTIYLPLQKEKSVKVKEQEETIQKLNSQVIILEETKVEAKEAKKRANEAETEIERLQRQLAEVTEHRDKLATDLENVRKQSEEVSGFFITLT